MRGKVLNDRLPPLCCIRLFVLSMYTSQNHIFLQFGKRNPQQKYILIFEIRKYFVRFFRLSALFYCYKYRLSALFAHRYIRLSALFLSLYGECHITFFKIQLRYLVGILSVYRPVSESYVSRTRQARAKVYSGDQKNLRF